MNFFNDYLNSIELPLLKEFHNLIQCDFLDDAFTLISSLCKFGWIWILLGLVFLVFRKTRKTGFTVLLSLIIGLCVCNLLIKPMTMRIRPYVLDPGISLLISPESDYSFPSGHALASFEGAFAIYLNHKRFGIMALLLATLIAVSRVYLQMHYFTDVIAGAILGVIIALVSYMFVIPFFKHKSDI